MEFNSSSVSVVTHYVWVAAVFHLNLAAADDVVATHTWTFSLHDTADYGYFGIVSEGRSSVVQCSLTSLSDVANSSYYNEAAF